jgi:integrase
MYEAFPMKLPEYVYSDPSRHGRPRLYFWRGRGHKKIRIRERPGTPEFRVRYADLLKQSEAGVFKIAPRGMPQHGTLRWLWHKFSTEADEHKENDPRTQHVTKLIFESMLREPRKAGALETFADCPLEYFDDNAVKVLRDRCGDKHAAANNRLKRLNVACAWAVRERIYEGFRVNPAASVKRKKAQRTDGFPTWEPADLDKFEARHPLGTKAHLALGLLQYTGVRRSDLVRLGRQHIKGNKLCFRMYKGRKRNPLQLELDIITDLRRILDDSPTGDLTFLVTQHGKPFTAAGFTNWFRDRCREAGLVGLSAHGVRKAAACRLAERGADPYDLMATFGWLTMKMAEHYTRRAEITRRTERTMPLLARNKAG